VEFNGPENLQNQPVHVGRDPTRIFRISKIGKMIVGLLPAGAETKNTMIRIMTAIAAVLCLGDDMEGLKRSRKYQLDVYII